jgi:hypothetical protein
MNPRHRTVSTRLRDKGQDNWSSIWRMFGLVFVLSTLLAIFILFRQRTWRGNNQRAFLVVYESPGEVRRPMSLVVLKPQRKVQVIPLPPEQIMEAPFGYGNYTSDALVGLTVLENLRWDFLQYVVALEYGVGVDGIIWSEQSDMGKLTEVKKLALLAALNQRPTTLAFWDRLILWQWLLRVPAYQFEMVDVKTYLNNETHQLDQARYDRWAELYLQDTSIRQSNYSVVVQNGTGVDGYAGRVGRMLSLMGFYVRGLETINEQKESTLVIEKQNQNWPGERLEMILKLWKKKRDTGLTTEKRVNAVLQLGTDEKEVFGK